MLIPMGGMMGGAGTGAWIVLWIFLGLAVVAAAGAVVTRALRASHQAGQPKVGPAETAGVHEAKEALRLRYAKGEIDREAYLQGKVELED
jgi:putative membrane protein